MSAITDTASSATLMIAVAQLSPELRDQLVGLGAEVVDLASLDQPLVIDLPTPLTLGGGEPVSQITIPEPTAAQMEMWSGMLGTTAEIKAVSVMAGVPIGIVKQMPARVFVKATNRINAFLG